MRIALYHNLTSGGSKREAFEFTKSLAAAGHHVDLYCPTTANELFLPLDDYVRRTFKYPLYLQPSFKGRLPWFRKYIDLVGVGLNLQRLQQVSRRIAQDIDKQVYDFVFVHHDQIVQSPYLLRYLETPSVYFCAEPMRQFYEPHIDREYDKPQSRSEFFQRKWYTPARWLQAWATKHVDQQNVKRANLLLTNSYFSAESIYRAYGLPSQVVYLGVDADKFKPLNYLKGDYVLSVGAVSPFNNFNFIIEAIGYVPQTIRPSLIIVGNTASLSETKFLTELALKHVVNLSFRVDVSESELVELYNRARAFVYAPILEPFGLTPVEAMACGIPVVAVKEGGVRESVVNEYTGFLVDRDPVKFAQKLTQLLQDDYLGNQLGKNGRKHVMDCWTWPHAYERFVDAVTTVTPEQDRKENHRGNQNCM